jgi:hypothetical protein
MLTGQRAFTGETTTDILAALVKSEPDLARVPAKVRRLLRRCLEKDPKKRLRDIGDAWELLEWDRPPGLSDRTPSRLVIGAMSLLAIALVVAVAGWWRATRPFDRPLTRFSVDLGPDALPGLNLTAAISPDGRRLVFPVRGPDGKQQLATRLLDEAQATFLPGTENGSDPFFSLDVYIKKSDPLATNLKHPAVARLDVIGLGYLYKSSHDSLPWKGWEVPYAPDLWRPRVTCYGSGLFRHR